MIFELFYNCKDDLYLVFFDNGEFLIIESGSVTNFGCLDLGTDLLYENEEGLLYGLPELEKYPKRIGDD